MTAFLGGLAQFFAPTQILAVLAAGLLAGRIRFPRLMLAMFAAGLLAGSLTVASAIREVPSAIVLLTIAAIAAGLVVADRPGPPFVATFLAGTAGASIPINAPPHEITIPAAIAAQAGTALAALTTFALVAFAAMRATRRWQSIGVRVLGSWIAASAILVLALRFAR